MREILLAIYQAGVEGMSISEAIEGAVAKFKQEIEGVENPNPFPKAWDLYNGFENCRRAILERLK